VLRAGVEVPLIPRYFDLLLLLLERRDEAVSRLDILDTVWSDVVVSDNALNQAIRSLRRAFEDDSRSPRFIATVARHGYRFVHAEVLEEPDEGTLARARADPPLPVSSDARSEALAKLLDRTAGLDTRLEAAVRLHETGSEQVLQDIENQSGHEVARALLRDARWDLPGAAPVPIWGTPGWLRTAGILTALRVRRAHAIAARRWAAAIMGGGLAGAVAGLLGGMVLRFGPGSLAGNEALVALPIVGLLIGCVGALGVGGGLALAEAVFRSRRGLALVISGGIGGLLVGAIAHGLGAALLTSLFGGDLSAVAGGFEGMTIGAAVGLGYALATPRQQGGMASPRGGDRLLAAATAGMVCGLATAILGSTGHFLGAMSLELLTQRFPGSQVGLAPLGQLLGEVPPGTLTAVAVSTWEGLWFGSGVAAGLTHRPQPTRRRSAEPAS
jgi:DNA-binding winged helix-turn-helix (wHTH) protein